MDEDTEHEHEHEHERALARSVRLGDAIRHYRGERTQAELGALLDAPQTTISRWEAGRVDLTLEQVRALEQALNLSLGTLPRSAGYAEPSFDDDEEPTLIRTTYYDSFDEVAVDLCAAHALGLGVRLWNRWVPVHGHDGMTMEWAMTLLADAPGDE